MSPLLTEGTDLAPSLSSTGGQTFVLSSSPLTRLNYFDGKFLRADNLRLEQAYVRQLVQFANQGLGAGIVYGIDTTIDDTTGALNIGPGLAVDSDGRPLLVPSARAFDVAKLIDVTRRVAAVARSQQTVAASSSSGAQFGNCVDATAPTGTAVGPGASYYVVCVGHAESLCGTEDVYGRLCEEACITATDRPYIVEGVIVRALPLTVRALATSKTVPLGTKHLRSLVASAFFEDERHVVDNLISRAGLALDVWCVGAEAASVGCVPLAIVGRSGTTTTFFDAWTVRRERIEAPARRYWAWRMAMRPWDVYLAQILQFQCQLHEVLAPASKPGDPSVPPDPCDSQRKLLDETASYLKQVEQSYAQHMVALQQLGTVPAALKADDVLFQLKGGAGDLASLRGRLDSALSSMVAAPQSQVLIDGGIVEIPAAGYLPVVPGTVSVNTQVRRLLGNGVDLRFCVVRPDFVAHALEEAQHMERISLLTGLDTPTNQPQVDILVPNGEIITAEPPKLAGFDTQVHINESALIAASGNAANAELAAAAPAAVSPTLRGAGRAERLASGGGAFYFAGGQEAAQVKSLAPLVAAIRTFSAGSTKTRNQAYKGAVTVPAPALAFSALSTVNESLASKFTLSAAAIRPTISSIPPKQVPAKPAPEPALVSLWISVRTDRDPYAMGTADATSIHGEIVLTSQVTTSTATHLHYLARLQIFGVFTVTQLPIDATSGRQMGGHLSGTVSTQTIEESTAGTNHAVPFEADVVLTRTSDATTASIRLTLTGNRFVMITDATWGGTPLTATVTVSLGQNTAKQEPIETTHGMLAGAMIDVLHKASIVPPVVMLAAKMVASDDALVEGGALRMLSTSAIELIGAEMSRANQGGPAFVDAAERSLFPPPPPAIDDLTVRPNLDWVLFQRRRTKTCATPAAVPPASPSRRYQVYHALAQDDQDAKRIIEALHTPGAAVDVDYARVDTIEFAGGLPTILSATDIFLQSWQAKQPGNRLRYGAIATSVVTDTKSLEDLRLSRVAQLLAPVSPPAGDTAQFETLSQVPAGLAVPGTDGVIFLVTETAVALTCHDVYRVVGTPAALTLLRANKLADLIANNVVQHIASVEFNDGSTAATADSVQELKQAWPTGGVPAMVVPYMNPSDSSGGPTNTLAARAAAIANAVGGSIAAADVSPGTVVANGWPAGPTCPVVTFVVVPAPRLVGVVAIDAAGNELTPKPDLLSFATGATLDAEPLKSVVVALQDLIKKTQLKVARIQYVFGAGGDADAAARLKSIIAAFNKAQILVPAVKGSTRALGATEHLGNPNETADDFVLLLPG